MTFLQIKTKYDILEHTQCPHHADKHNVINTPFYYFWQVVELQPVEEITIRNFQ